jgi:hypothetical protein
MLIFLDFEMHEEDSYMGFFFFLLEEGYKLSRDFVSLQSLIVCSTVITMFQHGIISFYLPWQPPG